MTHCRGTCAWLITLVVLALLGQLETAAAGPAARDREDRCDEDRSNGFVPAMCKPGEVAHCGLCSTRVCAGGRWSDCETNSNVPCVPPNPRWAWLSDGPQFTPGDIAQFDALWIQGMREGAADVTRKQICGRCDECVWQLAERMHALVRMRDLTRTDVYLEHLHDLVEHALAFRDDLHPGGVCEPGGPSLPPQPLDQVRGRNMRAWGGQSPSGGDMHAVNLATSSLYAYAMAAFARIVFEDRRLWDRYGSDAVKHANAVIETVWDFMPEVATRRGRGGVEAYLVGRLPGYKLPTKTQCDTAHTNEIARIERDFKDETEEERKEKERALRRAGQMLSDCKRAADADPNVIEPNAHNINLMFGMVLIELSRALDSPFYRSSPDASSDAQRTREMSPLLVSRLHRFFVNRLFKKQGPEGGRFCWNFSDDLADDKYHVEDTSHGAFDIRFLELLIRDVGRLNSVVEPLHEPIVLDARDLRRFANTFLWKIHRWPHLAENVTGKPMPSGDYDNACHGWAMLAATDARVYTACRNVTFRFFGRTQSNLGIGNHAALLANKRFAPPADPPPPTVIVPDVTELKKKDARDAVRAAGLVPKDRERTSGNWVARQDPAAGVRVPRGSTVVLSLRANVPN